MDGGIFEATRFAHPCEVSRGTIANYLAVLETTYVAHVIRPFSAHLPTEIISAPKVYAFDTGFVSHYRGWHELRGDDYGTLWEHYALNEIHAQTQSRKALHWRDKRGHEVDFVLAKRQGEPLGIECKWSAAEFDAANIKAFRARYPKGDNYVVATDVERSFSRTFGGIHVRFVSLADLIKTVAGHYRFPPRFFRAEHTPISTSTSAPGAVILKIQKILCGPPSPGFGMRNEGRLGEILPRIPT